MYVYTYVPDSVDDVGMSLWSLVLLDAKVHYDSVCSSVQSLQCTCQLEGWNLGLDIVT